MELLISAAHADCYGAFERLIEALRHPVRDFGDQLPVTAVEEEFDKYKIWAGNVGAGHFGKRYEISLDYRLREAKFLKDQVCIETAIQSSFLYHLGARVTQGSQCEGEICDFDLQ
jgi:hypothetical protein